MNRISKVTKIKIDDRLINCYTLVDGTILLEDDIREFYKANTEDNFTILEIITPSGQISRLRTYTLNDTINNLKPRFIKYLAGIGLVHLVETGITPPQERDLSDFDQAILKAMKYNPKEK